MDKKLICWDLDGTLLKDNGVYGDKVEFTPLIGLFDMLHNEKNCNIVVTGRTNIPACWCMEFDIVYCRDWEPENWDRYYPQYFQWKVDTILKLKPNLVFEDDQQICRYLTKKGINCIWVPEYAHMHQ